MSKRFANFQTIGVCLIVFLSLSACKTSTDNVPVTLLPSPQVTVVTSLPPTVTPSPTPAPTIEEWIFPYTIEGLREHDYQSGMLNVGDVLAETENFTRYAIDYPSDGLTITGIMQIPKVGSEPYPVIIMNHGFFSRAVYKSGDGSDRAAEFLNRHGYLTLSSDYRSWGDSDVGHSLFYSGLVIDVINLMNAVSSIPEADPERIGMWGHSMGGGTTLKVLTIDPDQNPGRIKAAVLYSTVSADDADIIDRWGPGCIGDYLAGEKLYGCNSSDILPLDLPPGLIQAYKETTRDPELLQQVAALHYLDDESAPVQIHYGTEDGEIFSGTPPEWSQKAYEGFIQAGKQAEIFAYEGEGHSFIGDPWWVFMERATQFFDAYVK
ncbi:MAG: alpha/beta hydrolase [Anaerolineales bacterium]|jgi:pimeloyl-ACP methyl ester carboxylesterase